MLPYSLGSSLASVPSQSLLNFRASLVLIHHSSCLVYFIPPSQNAQYECSKICHMQRSCHSRHCFWSVYNHHDQHYCLTFNRLDDLPGRECAANSPGPVSSACRSRLGHALSCPLPGLLPHPSRLRNGFRYQCLLPSKIHWRNNWPCTYITPLRIVT